MGGGYKFVLYYLWIAPHVLLAVILALMYARRAYKTFPLFFGYTVYEILQFLVLFFQRREVMAPTHSLFYRYVFMATLAGSTALRFGVIQEIFNDIFSDHPSLEGVATSSMRWVTVLLVLAATVAVMYSSGTVSENLLAGVALLDRSVAVIQAALLLFLFAFSRLFGLSWRSFAFGIALGFGVLASTELVVSAVRMTSPNLHVQEWLNLLPTGSYHVSVVVWLGYLLAVEKHPSMATGTVSEIEQWRGELERSL
jgi:hypothetical protein